MGVALVRWVWRIGEQISANRLGARFTAGVVLHTGSTAGPLGDRLAAVPMDILWTA